MSALLSNPAVLVGLIRAVLILLITFGVAISQAQQDSILELVGAVLAVISLLLNRDSLGRHTIERMFMVGARGDKPPLGTLMSRVTCPWRSRSRGRSAGYEARQRHTRGDSSTGATIVSLPIKAQDLKKVESRGPRSPNPNRPTTEHMSSSATAAAFVAQSWSELCTLYSAACCAM